jgi:hypothetical protein
VEEGLSESEMELIVGKRRVFAADDTLFVPRLIEVDLNESDPDTADALLLKGLQWSTALTDATLPTLVGRIICPPTGVTTDAIPVSPSLLYSFFSLKTPKEWSFVKGTNVPFPSTVQFPAQFRTFAQGDRTLDFWLQRTHIRVKGALLCT